ncbi:MAG: hypothetical protein FVQ83_03365 [Chloroflexi bacterium]|nr:hypothetical protein [Chloroflexota bacterium]
MKNKRPYIVPTLASIISYGVAISLSLAIQSWQWPMTYIYILGLVGVIATTFSAVSVEQRVKKQVQVKLNTNRDYCENNIQHILERATKTLVGPTIKVRANVFLNAQAKNQGVDLFIAFHFGMDNAPDFDIRFGHLEGVAGDIYSRNKKKPIVADLSHSPEEKLDSIYKLDPGQIAKTKHVKTILGIPIFHPKDTENVIGVFHIDSSDPIVNIFNLKETQEEAERVANLLVAFIWLGGIVERNGKWISRVDKDLHSSYL